MTTEPLLTPIDFGDIRSGDPQRMLDAATAEVRSYCRWHIAPEVTETVTVGGSGVALLLPTLHLTGITSITREGAAIDLTGITWKPNGIVSGYAFGGVDYEVTFTHGYATTPADIANVVANAAGDGIDGLRRLKSKTTGPFSESYDDGSADVAILDRYRLPSRP